MKRKTYIMTFFMNVPPMYRTLVLRNIFYIKFVYEFYWVEIFMRKSFFQGEKLLERTKNEAKLFLWLSFIMLIAKRVLEFFDFLSTPRPNEKTTKKLS